MEHVTVLHVPLSADFSKMTQNRSITGILFQEFYFLLFRLKDI